MEGKGSGIAIGTSRTVNIDDGPGSREGMDDLHGGMGGSDGEGIQGPAAFLVLGNYSGLILNYLSLTYLRNHKAPLFLRQPPPPPPWAEL